MTWPAMMFKHWNNMDVDDAGNGSVVSDDVWCPHCRNIGMIVLDDQNLGKACPMCVLGAYHNVRWGAPMISQGGKLQRAEVQHSKYWSWSPTDAPTGSWEHGLTFRHTALCGNCGKYPTVPGEDCNACQDVVRWGLAELPDCGRCGLFAATAGTICWPCHMRDVRAEKKRLAEEKKRRELEVLMAADKKKKKVAS